MQPGSHRHRKDVDPKQALKSLDPQQNRVVTQIRSGLDAKRVRFKDADLIRYMDLYWDVKYAFMNGEVPIAEKDILDGVIMIAAGEITRDELVQHWIERAKCPASETPPEEARPETQPAAPSATVAPWPVAPNVAGGLPSTLDPSAIFQALQAAQQQTAQAAARITELTQTNAQLAANAEEAEAQARSADAVADAHARRVQEATATLIGMRQALQIPDDADNPVGRCEKLRDELDDLRASHRRAAELEQQVGALTQRADEAEALIEEAQRDIDDAQKYRKLMKKQQEEEDRRAAEDAQVANAFQSLVAQTRALEEVLNQPTRAA